MYRLETMLNGGKKMNVYMTTGTVDFLKKIETKYSNEIMVTMINENGALLLHETNGPSEFKEPRKYEVAEAIGQIKKEGYVVMNYIPVTDEGRPLFEHQVRQQTQSMSNAEGFTVLRLLRPQLSSTYIIMTVWEKETYYQKWNQTESFFGTLTSIDAQAGIFSGAPYANKYAITD